MYYYPGVRIHNHFCTQSALSPLPGEHSGQSPFYRRAQCQLNHNTVSILQGPHLTPGSRAAMWIKCLAEGQKYRATVSHHYTTAPPINVVCYIYGRYGLITASHYTTIFIKTPCQVMKQDFYRSEIFNWSTLHGGGGGGGQRHVPPPSK